MEINIQFGNTDTQFNLHKRLLDAMGYEESLQHATYALCSSNGNVEYFLKSVFENGDDINKIHWDGKTLLHHAIYALRRDNTDGLQSPSIYGLRSDLRDYFEYVDDVINFV